MPQTPSAELSIGINWSNAIAIAKLLDDRGATQDDDADVLYLAAYIRRYQRRERSASARPGPPPPPDPDTDTAAR